jgi:DNA-directed RNA polymerase subunit beta'
VAGADDITQGLPRVEELFEARTPKGEAVISEIGGVVDVYWEGDVRKLKVTNTRLRRKTHQSSRYQTAKEIAYRRPPIPRASPTPSRRIGCGIRGSATST